MQPDLFNFPPDHKIGVRTKRGEIQQYICPGEWSWESAVQMIKLDVPDAATILVCMTIRKEK